MCKRNKQRWVVISKEGRSLLSLDCVRVVWYWIPHDGTKNPYLFRSHDQAERMAKKHGGLIATWQGATHFSIC